jgi:hypothetical protein
MLNVVLQNVAAPIENIIQFMGRNYIIPSFVIREPNRIPDSYLLVNPLYNDRLHLSELLLIITNYNSYSWSGSCAGCNDTQHNDTHHK